MKCMYCGSLTEKHSPHCKVLLLQTIEELTWAFKEQTRRLSETAKHSEGL
jgi:hypothetical protein